MRKLKYLLPLALFVPLLMAPSGGYPVNPTFQQVGVGVSNGNVLPNSSVVAKSITTAGQAFIQILDQGNNSGILCVSDTAALCSGTALAHEAILGASSSLNIVAPTVKVNGVALGQTAVGMFSQGVSTCTATAVNPARGMTCVTNAAGTQSTLTFSPAFATAPVCVAVSAATGTPVGMPSTPTTSGAIVNSTASTVFHIVCST